MFDNLWDILMGEIAKGLKLMSFVLKAQNDNIYNVI